MSERPPGDDASRQPDEAEVYETHDASKQGSEIEAKLIRAEAVYVRQGPLPDAEEVRRYETTLPGAADRIFAMAESEVSHRHCLESRGQWVASGLAFLAVAGGFALIFSGYGWYGLLFTAVGVAPIVYAFLRDRRRRSSNSDS